MWNWAAVLNALREDRSRKKNCPLLFWRRLKEPVCVLWPRSAVTGSCVLLGSSISVRLDLGTTRPGADRSSEYLGGRKAASSPGCARPAVPVLVRHPHQESGEGRSEGQSGALLQLIDCMSPMPNLLNSWVVRARTVNYPLGWPLIIERYQVKFAQGENVRKFMVQVARLLLDESEIGFCVFEFCILILNNVLILNRHKVSVT